MTVVVPIRDGLAPAPPAGTVDEALVKEFQDLLERVQAGEVIGVAYVALCPGDTTYYRSAGRLTRGVIGGIEVLKWSLCQRDAVRE